MQRLTWRHWLAIAIPVALLIAGLSYWLSQSDSKTKDRYKTAKVDQGAIVQRVSANGTLNPVVLVNVGTQVSGTIEKIYADYNDSVKAGQVLARLDAALLAAQLRQSQANLASADAALKLAEANARRAEFLFEKQMVSQANIDQAQQTLEAARAQVAAARAQVHRDQTNLNYTVIRSPVSGVVVARDVDVGQTVAASFQTPTLFKIAQDLSKMQIDTNVAEADIGGVQVGQLVRFTVDAHPSKEFQGTVKQIRLNPKIEQNVVTYNVVVAVDNSERLLMPGMTANVRIVVAERKDVLRVPNSALRFRPADADSDGEKSSRKRKEKRNSNTVYRLERGQPVAVTIEPGITDQRFTEVRSGELKVDDVLITEDRQAKKPESKKGEFRLRTF